MSSSATFSEVLDAIEQLPTDQQAELIDLVRRRLAERGRQQLIADVSETRAEHAAGKTRAASVDEVMREIES